VFGHDAGATHEIDLVIEAKAECRVLVLPPIKVQ